MSYVLNLFVVADKLNDLVKDQSSWSQETFGKDCDRGPLGALKHLEKEAVEAQKAWNEIRLQDALFSDNGHKFLEEMADCFLLQLDALRRAGYKFDHLLDACTKKMKVNRSRTWPKAKPDEPVEHSVDAG